MKYTYIVSAFIPASSSMSALAADAVFQHDVIPSAPLSVTPDRYDWTGVYAGATAGAALKGKGFSAFKDIKNGTFIGGVHVGYNFQTEENWVLGVEAEGNLLNDKKRGVSLKNYAAARVRAGYAFDRFLPYVDGGVVVGRIDANSRGGAVLKSGDNVETKEAKPKSEAHTHWGYTLGGGVEYALTDRVTTRVSYHYVDLKARNYNINGNTESVGYKGHVIGAGFSFRF